MREEFRKSTSCNLRWWSMRAAFVLAFALAARDAPAQEAFTVRAESGGQPLPGALIALVSSSNEVLSERLSGATGSVSLEAPAGDYRVRVRRIGYRPFYSNVVRLPQTAPLVLSVESPRVVLQEMVIGASAQCGRINPDAATLAALWEEISKALRASELKTSDLSGIARSESYTREVNSDGVVLSNNVRFVPTSVNRPFGSPDPGALVKLGYVRGDIVRGWEYFGPDEKVLLSDGFASTHCFRAVRDKNKPDLVGMSFRPAPKRSQSDIDGVIWLDQRSSELKEIEFEFVNAGEVTQFRPSGYTRFTRLPSGAWIVSDWRLRMPKLMEARGSQGRLTTSGYIETGGRIITVNEEKRL